MKKRIIAVLGTLIFMGVQTNAFQQHQQGRPSGYYATAVCYDGAGGKQAEEDIKVGGWDDGHFQDLCCETGNGVYGFEVCFADKFWGWETCFTCAELGY